MKQQSETPKAVRVLCILWPSFLMAGVLEMLVFAVVDPNNLQWFGADPIDWSATAVYTVSFFIFWTVVSMAGALTQVLATTPDVVNHRRQPAAF